MATAALNWHAALPQLGRHFRAVAPNLRGHGPGGRRDQPFTLDSCADELAETIEQLGLQGSTVVGYSMGGALAQVLARRHADLLGGIVLCATASEFAGKTWLRPAVRVVARAGSAAARQWSGTASAVLAWRLRRHDQAVARRTGATSTDSAWALDERGASQLAAFMEAGAELNAYDSSPWLASLRVPGAVVVTTEDAVVAPWRQDRLVELLGGAQRYEVAAGHDAVVARPDLFLPVLIRACTDLYTP
jgi:pimeloyl-ACP methyl ester carboxylesterase